MNWPKITKDTPLEEVKRIHQQIWDYVIKYGEKPDTPYFENCVLCEYDQTFNGDRYYICDHCPVNIPQNTSDCLNGMLKHFYDEIHSGDLIEAKKAAIAIRDIPFKHESKKE